MTLIIEALVNRSIPPSGPQPGDQGPEGPFENPAPAPIPGGEPPRPPSNNPPLV